MYAARSVALNASSFGIVSAYSELAADEADAADWPKGVLGATFEPKAGCPKADVLVLCCGWPKALVPGLAPKGVLDPNAEVADAGAFPKAL